MHIILSRFRHYRARTVALVLVESLMLSLLWPMAAHAQMDRQLDNVPLPGLTGEFQNTDGSRYAQNTNSGSMQTVTPLPQGQRPPITQPMLSLAPHCIEQDRTKCERFIVVDPLTVTTRAFALGDIIDIDVILETPSPAQVSSVRAWLQFDPTAIEARSIEMMPILNQPIPGEQEIDKSRGLVKIGGGTAAGTIRTQETVIARVTFRLLSAQQPTMILFSNYKPDGKGETTILDSSGNSLLAAQPSVTRVMVNQSGTIGQSSSVPYTPPPVTTPIQTGSMLPTTSPVTGGTSAFDILQVQGVRVTSQGDSLFIGWLPLQTQELAGYNVYYGTVSGRYIQRRGLTAGETSLVVRGLETGVQYFVAVRGFTAAGAETAFSQEASVVIGRPETSTAPLVQTDTTPPVTGNPIDNHGGNHVVGETGISDTVAVLLILAAIAGTVLAWRRQFSLVPIASHNE